MDRIIDIHTHILPGVDDGAKSIDDSIEIIEYLQKQGINDMVLTSHYIKGTGYKYNLIVRTNIINELRKKLEEKNIKVNLYLGNEVYLCDETLDLYYKHEICTLNNSKYMLVELPLSNYYKNYPNVLCDLNDAGIIPIIAHPERYSFLIKNKKRISELLEFNVLLQINIDSLIGKYGSKSKKLAKWLLKKNLVQFVATDTHYASNNKKLAKAYKKLRRIVGKEKYDELVYLNPRRALENRDVNRNMDFYTKGKTW